MDECARGLRSFAVVRALGRELGRNRFGKAAKPLFRQTTKAPPQKNCGGAFVRRYAAASMASRMASNTVSCSWTMTIRTVPSSRVSSRVLEAVSYSSSRYC